MSRPRVSIKSLAAASLRKHIAGRVTKARTKVSAAVVTLWRTKVSSSRLSSAARRRYSEAITPYKNPDAGAYLKGFIASLLETGWKRFDMKPGLLSGRSHNTVPMLTKGGGAEFRTVSAKSKPSSWIHPGFRGAKLVHRVKRSLNRLVREAMKE